jgi:3-oxoacyl-[acyl-carrier protein] reductase
MSEHESNVVIGGSGALGSEFLRLLSARCNARLIATYRNSTPPQDLRAKVHWVRFDAGSQEGLDDLCSAVGDRELRCLLYTAGEPSSKQVIVDTGREEWERLWRSNVLSFADVYSTLHSALRRSRARVLVVSSETTKKLGVGNGPYSATKAALEAIAMTLAHEEAPHGVRVNVLAPSLFDSPLADYIIRMKGVRDSDAYRASLPWGRAISLGEAAGAAYSILCDECWSYASGQIFRLAVG